MIDKLAEVVEKYDMEIYGLKRGRGGLIYDTNRGKRQLVKLNEGEKHIYKEHMLKEELYRRGFKYIDRFYENSKGELLTYDRYRTPYILREYFEGRECNLESNDDLMIAANNLGQLHMVMRDMDIWKMEEEDRILRVLDKRNRELVRVKKYIKYKNDKNEFELVYTACFDKLYDLAKRVEDKLATFSFGDMKVPVGICHGTYNQHNVVIGNDYVATINLDRFFIDNQLMDLYQLIRKTMEKTNYELNPVKTIIEEYEKIVPLGEIDYKFLYLMLMYPEKFYKITNRYYNTKKTFVPPKMLEKLKNTIEKQQELDKFLVLFSDLYGIHI